MMVTMFKVKKSVLPKFIVVLALVPCLLGCNSGDASILGIWVCTIDVPKNLPNSIRSTPEAAKDWEKRMAEGSVKYTYTLNLTQDHRFLWKPFNWQGSWRSNGSTVTLQPDEEYKALLLLNSYGTRSSGGKRTVTIAYSSEIEHLFQSKSNTRSNPFRTVIPIESEHRFQRKSNAFRVGLGVA
jgi:hypothetical protein